jgi:hypothetical protein
MSVTMNEIGWGSYDHFEGPYYHGHIPYVLPDNPDFLDKTIRVVTATEGGSYSAINMYDSCILSVGLIQFCEKLLLTTEMLGECAVTDLDSIKSAFEQLPTPADFRQNSKGQWRVCADNDEIDNLTKMREFYLGGSSGLKNQWTNSQKIYARQVAAVFASLWDSPSMRDGQARFVKRRIMSFVMSNTKQALFTNNQNNDGYDGALKAALVSFSANIPVTTDKLFIQVFHDSSWASANSCDKFTFAMKNLVFGSKIAIWPARYKAIHPVIENLFNISLPSLDELASDGDNTSPDDDSLTTPVGLQKALITLGYDLGPKGADGSIGPKTQEAIIAFQGKNNLIPDGVVGPKTIEAMLLALKNL